MAWVRCCGGSKTNKAIYKDGVLYVAIGTYPSYSPSGNAHAASVNMSNDGTQLSFNMTRWGTSSFISDEIDVTNISAIKITFDSISANYDVQCGLMQGSPRDGYQFINAVSATQGVVTVSTLNLTGNYRFVIKVYASSVGATLSAKVSLIEEV